MRKTGNPLFASLYRDWRMMRTWVWCMGILALIGPCLNLLSGIFSNSLPGRIGAAWIALYTVNYLGPLGVDNGRLVAQLDHPKTFIAVHGYPAVSMNLLIATMTLGVVLTTLEKQRSYALDAWMEPISRKTSLHSKIAIGLSTVIGISIARSVLIAATIGLSPHHFASSQIGFDVLSNFTISLTVLAVGILAGTLVGNVLLGWCVSFVFVMLPIVIQTVIDFYTLHSGSVAQATIVQGHIYRQFTLLDRLTPVMYTNLGVNESSSGGHGSNTITFTTYAQHPWWIAAFAIAITVLLLCTARIVYTRQDAQRSFDWMTSMWGYRIATLLAAAEFGCVVALILQSQPILHPFITWPLASVAGHIVIQVIRRIADGAMWKKVGAIAR